MNDDLENPYRVLGIERTADERAIKKAYVALVRKFPPEKHPEDFKKIRAAYELLSDASARARFDDGEKGYAEYGEELSKRLEDVDKATGDKNIDLAREILTELAEKFPDASVVKEKLGFIHLGAGDPERALALFAELATKEPTNARHHLHRAFALARLERHPQVEKALREASHLDPKDVRIALALIDFFIGRERTAEAVEAASAIMPHLEPNSLQVAVVLLRKLEAHAMGGHDVTSSVELGELRALVRTSSEENLGSFVSGQIAAVAAKLFATKHPGAANRLLALCSDFDPKSLIERPLPAATRVVPEALPEAFRTWLEQASRDESSPFVLRHNRFARVGFFVALSVAAFVGAAALASGASPRTDTGSFIVVCILVALTAGALAFSVMELLRIVASPLRSVTTLHPLYLVRATPKLVELYSLFMLTETRGVHQHTNGVYTGTQITLTFGDHLWGGAHHVPLQIRGQEAAQRFIDALLGVRGRSLELLAEGALEAEHLVEDLPPGKLRELPRPPKLLQTLARPLAMGLATAVLVATPLAVMSTNAEDAAIAAAASARGGAGSLDAYRSYLGTYPNGRHRAIAEAQLHDAYARMIEGLRIDPSDPGEAALVKAVEHLRDQGGPLVIDADVEGEAYGDHRRALAAAGAHFEKVFRAAGLGGLTLRFAPPTDGPPGARVVVRLRPGATTTLVSAPLPIARSSPDPKTKSPPLGEPVPLDVHGAHVEVAIEIAGKRVFERTVDAAPPSLVSARRGEARSMAATATLDLALDAATRGLGMYAPAARAGGAP